MKPKIFNFNFSHFFNIIEECLETEKAGNFLSAWILANILGWSIATYLILTTLEFIFGITCVINTQKFSLVFNSDNFGQIDGLVLWFGALFGEVFAIAQWLVLRNHFSKINGWLFATSLGWIVASFAATSWLDVNNLIALTLLQFLFLAISHSLFWNIVVSLTQALLIKRHANSKNTELYWIIINSIGVLIGSLTIITLTLSISAFLYSPSYIAIAIMCILILVANRQNLVNTESKLKENSKKILLLILEIIEKLLLFIYKNNLILILVAYVFFIFFSLSYFNDEQSTHKTLQLFGSLVTFLQSLISGLCLVYFFRDRWL